MRTALFFMLLCCSSFIYGQQSTIISGTIKDGITKKPIPNAIVGIDDSPTEYFTDINGKFKLETSQIGEHILHINAPDYLSKRLPIILEFRSIDFEEIVLEKDITTEKADNLITLTDGDLSDDEQTISGSLSLLQSTKDIFLNRAAFLNKRIIDSIQKLSIDAKIISMGDLNDDPRDDSLKKVLKTIGKENQLDSLSLFNPMEKLHKKGLGSLAYRDKWNLFDQFFMTSNLINTDRKSYSYWKAGIYAPSKIRTIKGRYKGYPFRTYSGSNYTGGYSDHFPVYLYLVKEVK